jgi:hypothetical protein
MKLKTQGLGSPWGTVLEPLHYNISDKVNPLLLLHISHCIAGKFDFSGNSSDFTLKVLVYQSWPLMLSTSQYQYLDTVG